MHSFFVDPSQIQGTEIVITGSDVNHIKNVLRMKAGEELSVSNGVDQKEYRCGIEEFREDRILCKLRFVKEDGVELSSKIYLFQGLPKADKMELIIQKAVEGRRKTGALAGNCRGSGKTEQKARDSADSSGNDHERGGSICFRYGCGTDSL